MLYALNHIILHTNLDNTKFYIELQTARKKKSVLDRLVERAYVAFLIT